MTAALRAEHGVLFRGLHSLVLPAPDDAGDESPVDLEDADGVAAQVEQGAVAGAEVVVELPRGHVQSKIQRQEQIWGTGSCLWTGTRGVRNPRNRRLRSVEGPT